MAELERENHSDGNKNVLCLSSCDFVWVFCATAPLFNGRFGSRYIPCQRHPSRSWPTKDRNQAPMSLFLSIPLSFGLSFALDFSLSFRFSSCRQHRGDFGSVRAQTHSLLTLSWVSKTYFSVKAFASAARMALLSGHSKRSEFYIPVIVQSTSSSINRALG